MTDPIAVVTERFENRIEGLHKRIKALESAINGIRELCERDAEESYEDGIRTLNLAARVVRECDEALPQF